MSTQKTFKILFLACMLFLFLGQLSGLLRFNQVSVYLFDLFIALFNLLALFFLIKSQSIKKPPLPLFMLFVFIALGAVSLLVSPITMELSELLTAFGYLLRFILYLLFIWTTHELIKLRILKTQDVLKTVVFGGIALFVLGLLQLIFLPDFSILNPSLGWDPHKNRMASTFFDPNFLGMFFVACLAAVFMTREYFKQNVQGVLIAIFLLGIFLTFSRSAWIALAVLIFFAGLRRKGLLFASIAIILLAVFTVPRVQTRISGITDPQDSAAFRITSWKNTWEIIQDNWVFGIGYNSFRYAQYNYKLISDDAIDSRSAAGSDASLLLVWATSGIFGLCFVLGFFGSVLIKSLKHRDLITIGLTLALLVNSLFINSFFYPQIFIVCLLVVAAKVFEPLTSAM